jgi:hypothetical protein
MDLENKSEGMPGNINCLSGARERHDTIKSNLRIFLLCRLRKVVKASKRLTKP